MEPPDLWQRYIDPAYAHAAPIGLTEVPRDMRVRVKNHTVLRLGRVRPVRREGRRTGWRPEHDSVYAAAEQRGWDPVSQIEAMDAEGLDLAVLFPSRGLFVLGLDSIDMIGPDGLEPEYASAIARAYNDWLADFCGHAPDRMYGAAMVAPHDVDGAVAEAAAASTSWDSGPSSWRPAASIGGPGIIRRTTRCGPRSSGSTSRWPSMAVARPTSGPTSPWRCSTGS
jgi:hypothetical protein